MADFEQSLREELATITGLNSKVFPLFAPEGTTAPFVVYQKTRTDFTKTLDGTQWLRDGYYELDLLAPNYAQLQSIYIAIVTKLKTFVGRVVGTNGVYVQDVTINNVIELYENTVELHRMNLELRFYF